MAQTLLEQAEAGTLTLTWRAVGDNSMCPDCAGRHGFSGFTLEEWRGSGLPGSGWSICKGYCRCTLLPDNLLSVDTEILEPFEIGPTLDDVPDVSDPIEAARIATNIRLLEDFRSGQRVRYRGPIRRLNGETATVQPGVDPVDGLKIEFDFPDPRFPEFAEITVLDFADLVPAGGNG